MLLLWVVCINMMNSSCVAGCLNDAVSQVPLRLSFMSMYQWPDSDAEFVRMLSTREEDCPKRKLITYDAYACRQMFLRSYTFSRKETVPQKTKKVVKRAKAVMLKMKRILTLKRIMHLLRKLKAKLFKAACDFFAAIFSCLLACTTSVDVKDQQQHKRP